MKLQLLTKPANLQRWDHLVHEVLHPQREVTIAMCGKYTDLSDSYKSLNEALRHAGIQHHARVKIEYVDSETLNADSVASLAAFDAILVPGGFGKRGIEGKIAAAAVRPASTSCPTWASAWACRWPPSRWRATWPAWPVPTPPSSSPTPRTR